MLRTLNRQFPCIADRDVFLKAAVPAAVGVPLISLVSLFSLRPAGRSPPPMLRVMGAVPVTIRVWLYFTPTLLSGRLSVVMVIRIVLRIFGTPCKAERSTV